MLDRWRRALPALALVAVGAVSPGLLGCWSSSFNVRAARAFGNEQPDDPIVADRVSDLSRTLELADELLLATPYTPGDAWVLDLRLEDDDADALRDQIGEAPPYSGDYEVPVLKLYRVHLERVLAKARARHTEGARYPGLIDAMAELAPGAASLRKDWEALGAARLEHARAAGEVARVEYELRGRRPSAADQARRSAAAGRVAAAQQSVLQARLALTQSAAALSLTDPKQGNHVTVSRDALAAASIVLRMDLEALAIAPYAIKHARKVQRPDLGAAAERARVACDEQRILLDDVTASLSRTAGVPVGDSAGFAVEESLIVQAAAVNWDATHVHVKGDAELLFFHQLASANASGGNDDYTGRTTRLAYSIDPVFMLGARVIAAYDWLHVKNAASLNAGFTTDRLFSKGGDIGNDNSLGNLLGLEGLVSDFFDIGAGLAGFRTSVRIATFTSGEVREIGVNPTTGADTGEIARAPFQLTFHQIDVGYDISLFDPELAEQYSIEDFLVGFRYMSYRLPRVFYELHEKTPGDDSVYVLDRESPPQTTDSQFYMGGFAVRFGEGDWQRLTVFGDVGLYGGGGPIDLHFARDPAQPDSEANRVPLSATMLALDGVASLGLRLRLTPRRGRLRAAAELQYRGEVIGQGIVSEIYATKTENGTSYTLGKKIDVGGFDLFHGPRLRLVAVF